MEIVPTSHTKHKNIDLKDLMIRKAELKIQIEDQKLQINGATKKLLSFETFTSYIFSSIQKSITLADGVLLGMKFVDIFKRIFRKKK